MNGKIGEDLKSPKRADKRLSAIDLNRGGGREGGEYREVRVFAIQLQGYLVRVMI